MTKRAKTLEFVFERRIPAPPKEVFDAWLSPKVPGTVWNAAERFVLDAKIDGLFYWTLKGTSHYGRFTKFNQPRCIQHTWMSPNTLGYETTITLTFEKIGQETLMTLVHADLPNHELARGHENGWNYFLGIFREQFGDGSRKKYNWDDAHRPVKK